MLLSALVVSWFVWGPFGGIFYVGGLFNLKILFMLVPFLFLLILAAAICTPVLMIRMIARWSRLNAQGKRWHVGATIVASAFAGSFALGFTGCMPSPMDMFARGFVRYVDGRADIVAIQNWLDTLDPSDYQEPGAVLIERVLPDSEQPPSIAHLRPKMVKLMLDDSERRTVRLLWGGGMIGHWGIVVGGKDMPMPPSDSYTEYFSLASGAYVWSGD